MIDLLVLIIILSFVVYRCGRFIVLDTMFGRTRDRLFGWLVSHDRMIWHKIAELLGCPYCITIWVSAAVCLIWRWTVGDFAAPVAVWLAAATGSLIVWRIVDFEQDEDD